MPKQQMRIVIDNGGSTCKVGFAGQTDPVRLMTNGQAKSKSEHKVFVADQFDSCNDFSALQYRLSLERGCLVNWDTQAEVWARAFGPDVLRINPSECSLLLSETPLCPTAIQDTLDEMVFEHFGFDSYCTRQAPVLAALAAQQQQQKAQSQPTAAAAGAAEDAGGASSARPATLVVDCGFSATHCVPIFGGVPLNFATKRLNVGGKMLTNHLKQIISYRSYNVMEETHLINDVKERLCYVSLDLPAELALTRFKGKKNTLRRDFIMPDYVNHFKGQIRDPNAPEPPKTAPEPLAAAASAPPAAAAAAATKKGTKTGAVAAEEQVLHLSNERISVPEILFRPSDIGLEQAGVAECVVQAVEACLPDLREALYSNVVVTGGSSRFPNFGERLQRELRALVPADMEIGLTHASDPLLATWRGGSLFASSEAYPSQTVTRAQYHEEGHSLCRRRFLSQQCW